MKVKVNDNREGKQDLEYLVLKNFIAVLKKNGMYPMFRCAVGTNTKNVVSSIYKRMNSFDAIQGNSQNRENIFRDAGNIDVFLKMMKSACNGGIGTNYDTQDPAQLQGAIANTINMLLHVFIERNVRDIQKLEMLGGQIFEMTCKEIFGDKFEDMLPKPTPEMERLHQMMASRGMRPTQEMIDEINRMISEGRLPQLPRGVEMVPRQPAVNEEEWDFLDDWIDDEDVDDDWTEEEDENFVENEEVVDRAEENTWW